MKKQFDLEYYLEHPETKVVTRDNRNVRIICTDCKDPLYPIIALIDANVVEYSTPRKANGCKFTDCREHAEDLFFDLPDPVKKKVPLTYEDLLERIKVGKTMWMQLEYAPGCYSAVNIISFNHIGIKYGDVILSYKDIITAKLTFANGDLCWKEVEE